jgi:uncharacterized protein with PQ loop repeat
MTFGCNLHGQAQKILKRKSGGFLQVQAVVSFVSSLCMWLIHARKVFQPHTNQLVVWFVQVHVNN